MLSVLISLLFVARIVACSAQILCVVITKLQWKKYHSKKLFTVMRSNDIARIDELVIRFRRKWRIVPR